MQIQILRKTVGSSVAARLKLRLGAYFGEVGLLLRRTPMLATVSATVDSTLLTVSRDEFVSILANNNKISRVGELPPSVDSVILTNNRLTSLGDLAALGELPALRTLSLLKNPVARQQHYREYLVHLCPKLRFLDFQLVKEAERKQAARFFKSAAGKKLLEEVRPSTEEEVLSASQDERAAPSLAPAIAKRKKLSADIVQKIQVRFLCSSAQPVNWWCLG